MRHIEFGITSEGLFVSRFNHKGLSDVAYPVLDYDAMVPENNFKPSYNLEKMPLSVLFSGAPIIWTRKVPLKIKNKHRKFWGMAELSRQPNKCETEGWAKLEKRLSRKFGWE